MVNYTSKYTSWIIFSYVFYTQLTNYQVYTSVLHTKQLLYYSRHSILTVEHHASFNWWARSLNLNSHRKCFLVWNFVRTSVKRLHCATSLSIRLCWNFHICVRAFRLTACVICLMMLSQYTTFSRQSREEACMRHHEQKRMQFTARAVLLNCPAVLPFKDGLCLGHRKNEWN